jgi:Holliday junction resolvase RusA-like endonuclease
MMNHNDEAIVIMDRNDKAIDDFFGKNHYVVLDPTPQARHRVNGHRTFDPHAGKKLFLRQYIFRYLEMVTDITNDMLPLTESYVSIALSFYISRPIAHFVNGDRTKGIRPQFENVMPTTSGDIDNYVKFFLDAINGIFFIDDRNVVALTASKHYCRDDVGRTIYNIRLYETNVIDLTNDNDDNNNNNNNNNVTEVIIIN